MAHANLVSSTTSQLMAASGAKENSAASQAHRQLMSCGSDIARAVKQFVGACNNPTSSSSGAANSSTKGYAETRANQINQEAKIIELERKLTTEKQTLYGMRKQEYEK